MGSSNSSSNVIFNILNILGIYPLRKLTNLSSFELAFLENFKDITNPFTNDNDLDIINVNLT
jgi:hypothetical protein